MTLSLTAEASPVTLTRVTRGTVVGNAIAALILAIAATMIAALIGMAGFHARIALEARKCDTGFTYAQVVERGQSVSFHPDIAPATVDRTTVYCFTYDGRY